MILGAGHHIDIADAIARRGADRIVDQHGAVGRIGQAQARLVEHARLVVPFQQLRRLGMADQRHAKSSGNALRGDVVMGRPDAAGREDMIVTAAQRIDRADDLIRNIGDDPRLAELDPQRRHALGQIVEVHILRTAGKDLVADDQHGRRNDRAGVCRCGHGWCAAGQFCGSIAAAAHKSFTISR
jgi:hypothetical protein